MHQGGICTLRRRSRNRRSEHAPDYLETARGRRDLVTSLREREAAALDARILDAIGRWQLDERAFERLALDLFAHQVRFNAAYAAFAEALGFDALHLPRTWREIPAAPSLAFKESSLATFDPAQSVQAFETSGTTQGKSGRHFFERTSLQLYDAALLAGFDRFILEGDQESRLRYFLLVPDRSSSSLGYMMRRVAEERGDGLGRCYLDAAGSELDTERFVKDAERSHEDGVAVCIAGTAFAFVALLDELRGRRIATKSGSRIMETGGFKGRSREVERSELYAKLSQTFGIAQDRIVAEYGMTELTSQYYDAPSSRTSSVRVKIGPPWLRPLIVGADGREVALGESGAVRHIDLANRGSVVAIQTEDLALRREDGFVLLGRDAQAPLRGCSLDAEELIARRS